MADFPPSQPGFDRLLIRTAFDADLRQRLLDSPDSVFAEFELTEEEQDLLRHPDHRLLPLLGAMLARQDGAAHAAAEPVVVDEIVGGNGAGDSMSDGPPPLLPPSPRTLPDVSLALTVVPCTRPGNSENAAYSYAVWVNPLPAGADPSTLPPPPGAQLPGPPLLPLHVVVQLNATEFRDAAGRVQVGLSASLRQSSNITSPPPPESQGPLAQDHPPSPAVASAVANVRSAAAGQRYHRLIDLLPALDASLHNSGAGFSRRRASALPCHEHVVTDLWIAGLGIQTVAQITREVEQAIRASREVLYLDTGVATRAFLETLCPRVTALYTESYFEAENRVQAYEHMAARIVDAALDHPPITFAIHGHPLVAVDAPFLVMKLAAVLDLNVAVLPGISGMDTIFADLRIDPVVHGVQMYEATDLLLRRRPLDPTVPAVIWQIGPLETVLHTMHVSRPERFARFTAHLRQFYPATHRVAAIYSAPHPIMPPRILHFAIEDMGQHAADLHAGFSLYIPPSGSRPIHDYDLLSKLDSLEHLRNITDR